MALMIVRLIFIYFLFISPIIYYDTINLNYVTQVYELRFLLLLLNLYKLSVNYFTLFLNHNQIKLNICNDLMVVI
jgi:hypothetical protein